MAENKEEQAALWAELKAEIARVRQRQADIFAAHPEDKVSYIAHGTHMAPEDFLTTLSDGKQYGPIFSKETQNELDVIKEFRCKHPEFTASNEELSKELNIPPRLFGIPTKRGQDGKPVMDENGFPVPQDGSYAYAIKKCSAMINVTEDNEPILIGMEEKYVEFEEGKQAGHIYIVDGDTFKPEYASNEQVTEYTTQHNPSLVKHLEVTPKDAMEHNAQIIVFRTEKLLDDWLNRKSERFKGGFDINIKKDSELMAMLAEEVRAGRAVYINATERGTNPRIPVLEAASQDYEHRAAFIRGETLKVREKIEEKQGSARQDKEGTAAGKKVAEQGNVFRISGSSVELG